MSTSLESVLNILVNHLVAYPTPFSIGYLWSFGAILGCLFVFQAVSGLVLSTHYEALWASAQFTIDRVAREIPAGWSFKYLHSSVASFFFFFIIFHIFRGLYFFSYTYLRQVIWFVGFILYVCTMAAAFMGYVLPMGQMSYWGATVITNLLSVIPLLGVQLTGWLWGGFAVGGPTLVKFFSLHYFVAIIIAGLIGVHLYFLHLGGSSDPVTSGGFDNYRLSFYPYFAAKDFFSIKMSILLLSFFFFLIPDYLGHPDNYIVGNSVVTPLHIVPEWYFLPYYAILRSVPDKLLGTILMGLAVFIFYFISGGSSNRQPSGRYNLVNSVLFGFIVWTLLILGWVGGQAVTDVLIKFGQSSSFSYYQFFTLALSSVYMYEWLHNRAEQFFDFLPLDFLDEEDSVASERDLLKKNSSDFLNKKRKFSPRRYKVHTFLHFLVCTNFFVFLFSAGLQSIE